jgi:hypothetical protein
MAATATGTVNHQYPFNIAQKLTCAAPIQCIAATNTTAKPANNAPNSSHELCPDNLQQAEAEPKTTQPEDGAYQYQM